MGRTYGEHGRVRWSQHPPWLSALATVLLIALVATADWFSAAEVAASLGYLIPISVAAWCHGRRVAAAVAISCAATWLWVDVQTRWDQIVTHIEVVNLTVLFVVFVVFGVLLGNLRHQLERHLHLAHTDSLTGIPNRRSFWNAARRELERCRRHGLPFTVAYLDLDGFKGVNDRFGHRRGDELLRQVAQALPRSLRTLDMAARVGGDEFALLLPGTDEQGARAVLERLTAELGQLHGARALGVGFSIGGITVLTAPETVDAVMARADALMYEMKRSGAGQLRHEAMGVAAAPAGPPRPRERPADSA